MYDDVIKNKTINNLEQKVTSIANTIVSLTAQGYVINSKKRIKLDWSSVLLHAFENINILNKEQQKNIENLYNKLFTI